ncbi:histone-lysine N-methyltransferase [Candidatus Termititenax persephonae]|uniref:Histone-lysine N-methyltransferase n=1 Tax=Candidatus Termititenax persephonae TaxID=2218525 RepID=A0A388TFV6_9BACT|nr:histone-lysine N-methyltransferase [Candidatus Termititenax persephonae]
MKRYKLKNVTQPNLYEQYFDYSKVPAITFEENSVPFARPSQTWITDTTFRDGQQSRPPYDIDQIVRLYEFLHQLSGPHGVIRQSEFFLYTDKDKKAVEKCLELGHKFPEITGWIRAVKEDFKLVKAMGLRETGILTSSSDFHIFLKLKKNREQVLNDYLSIVDAALAEGVRPRCHFEDITRADFEGFVLPFAQALMERSRQAKIPIKIRACDTLGLALPYPNAPLPRSIPKIFHMLHQEAGVPQELLEWHGHNDFHKVLINSTTAWLYGCAAVNGTLLGWGERTGNAPIEALLMDYIALHGGDQGGIDTTIITEVARYYHDDLGDPISPNQPFVGRDFNTTRAGIHADGAIKNERIYNIFDTGTLLNRPMSVAITDKSGTAGIALWLNNYFRLPEERKIDKNDPRLQRIYKWVMAQYAEDRVSTISEAELIEQAKKNLPSLFHSDLEGLKKKGSRLAAEVINELFKKNLPTLLAMDAAVIEPILQEVVDNEAAIKLMYVVDAQGHKITRNITQQEDQNKYSGLGSEFADRRWFKDAIATKKVLVSDFYMSKFIGELCVTVSRPLINAGEIIGVVGIDINFNNLIKLD